MLLNANVVWYISIVLNKCVNEHFHNIFILGDTENFEDIFEGTTKEPGEFAVAIFYSIFSYGGW